MKNERFAAPDEYLAKKDEEIDKGFIEGRKKRTKHRKWRKKKETEIFNKERDNENAIN